jgi:hypothetical protein
VGTGFRIVGIDGIEQRFQARGGEPLGSFAVMSFSNEKRSGHEAGSEG